jgi:hypothetical protein
MTMTTQKQIMQFDDSCHTFVSTCKVASLNVKRKRLDPHWSMWKWSLTPVENKRWKVKFLDFHWPNETLTEFRFAFYLLLWESIVKLQCTSSSLTKSAHVQHHSISQPSKWVRISILACITIQLLGKSMVMRGKENGAENPNPHCSTLLFLSPPSSIEYLSFPLVPIIQGPGNGKDIRNAQWCVWIHI